MSMAHDWALFFDLYHPNMADGYWRLGRHQEQVVFNLFFRRNPFGNGFVVVAGLEKIVRYLEGLRFSEEDLEYLRSLGMFSPGFLEYLRNFRFTGDLDAMPEGSIAFPYEPIIRVKAPIVEALLLEVFLTNAMFQSLVATKTARVVRAAQGRPVYEFGARRAQEMDAAVWGSRAAIIAGCAGTSNVLAAKMFGLKPVGTHAHAWVMSFPSELEAFRAWAQLHPDSAIFLVDTYDTLKSGVPNAITVGRELEARGGRFAGIRLDSGKIPYLSQEARRMLDEAGFPHAKIMASGDLDEIRIQALLLEGAQVDAFGVGTRLITAMDDPSLGAVYKMVAREENGRWVPTIKVSEDPEKLGLPGDVHPVRVYHQDSGKAAGDVILPMGKTLPKAGEELVLQDPIHTARRKRVRRFYTRELLVPIFRSGKRVYELPSVAEIQKYHQQELDTLWDTYKQLVDPEVYPVNPAPELIELRNRLVAEKRAGL
ncbi:MAG TPA: nicotinate phosphoribosyltransferase [Symbiobacteriaceae bacterium]